MYRRNSRPNPSSSRSTKSTPSGPALTPIWSSPTCVFHVTAAGRIAKYAPRSHVFDYTSAIAWHALLFRLCAVVMSLTEMGVKGIGRRIPSSGAAPFLAAGVDAKMQCVMASMGNEE